MRSLSHRSEADTAGPHTFADLAADAATLFVVDQDIRVRAALTALAGLEGLRCQVFESAEAFLSCPPPTAPQCLILDVNLPDFGAHELQTQMAVRCRGVPIIFMTDVDAVPTTVRAMKPDTLEFLARSFDEEALLIAVRKAVARSAADRRHELALDQLRQRYGSLTPREREVMHLVVAGLQNKQVARRLDVAEITVKVHRSRVMEKMRAASFADLVKMSVQLPSDAGGDARCTAT
jgi:FixJ family two-component response regulator